MSANMVVVTGGSSGIGRAAVLQLGAARTPVAVLDRDENGAKNAAAAGAPEAAHFACDVTDPNAVEDAVSAAVQRLGPPAGLLTAAGIDINAPAHELLPQDFSRVLSVNLTGAYLAARSVISVLLAQQLSGSIVMCSSPAAFVAFAAGGTSAYSASKGGVSALVRSLAIDYAPNNIRVNAIVPGPTETPLMWASVPENQRDAMRRQLASEVPLGRLADSAEPARAAVWLLGPDSSYVTGTQLVCDGGVLAKSCISV
ncbi:MULTISPECIES: SDR family NAD(P)-dependent oxidoreductase [unclassified Mycolicibacterium]|uniref:SDR family NAD(P)-dependent oxidoreductase n=1 Tax=unclassified Mycolicibacterium TaxID=2636767 RepID=UPI002EDBA25E